jgi:hypothetical protein
VSCCSGNDPACPCGAFQHPWVIANVPGLSALSVRSGDYVAYRHALLQTLDDENELSQRVGNTTTLLWRPTAEGDLALQMIEWWAYLSDILTFYNERVANESYLRTAILPESVRRLIGLLGYRPRPALGASGTLAALVNRARPVVVPQGLQIQSKPGPGETPQVFEVDTDTTVARPDASPATAAPQPPASLVTTPAGSSAKVATLLVAGRLGTVKAGDELLLVHVGWDGTTQQYAAGKVQSLTDQVAPSGSHNTQVTLQLTSGSTGITDPQASSWHLMKSGSAATLYPYLQPPGTLTTKSAGAPYSVDAHLASVFRQIKPGDLILVDDTRVVSPDAPYLGLVTAYSEAIYFANNPTNPSQPPQESPASGIPSVPVLHSVVTFQTPNTVTGSATTVVLRYGWKDVGQLIDPPATTVDGSSGGPIQINNPATAAAASGDGGALPVNSRVLVEDVNGDGAFASLDGNGNLTLDPDPPTLTPPLTTLFNLVGVSRGKTVSNEVLGSGDGTVLSQDFQLQKAPVTYFADAAGISGAGYSSTVKVWVNNVQWQEVASFFGQPVNAQIFRTREDDDGNTHVVFGSRLPTGVNNVIASYRYGAGADTPHSGALTSILQPQPGLASVVNPVAPTGGADADPPAKIRTLAPQSVLTFGRAVSLDDYQTLAAGAGGVTAAQATYTFDPLAQRPTVHVWVAGDAGAADAARAAIAGAADPNRSFKVEAATALTVWLTLTYVRDTRYQDAVVKQGVHDALLDPDKGVFGDHRVQIGKAYFNSDVYAACLKVPGVVAVHSLSFDTNRFIVLSLALGGASRSKVRFQPWIFRRPLRGAKQDPCQIERYDPGDGNYFQVPDDSAHLTLNAELPA